MKKIAIYGAGGFGREVYQLIEFININNKKWEIIGFFDDNLPINKVIHSVRVIGGIKEINSINFELDIVVAIANPEVIKKIYTTIINDKISFPNLFHPSVILDFKYNLIGKGNIITFGCFFTTGIHIGNFNILNTRVTFGHDVKIGSFNVFQPNVQISGNVVIEDSNYWGVNSLILSQKKVGSNNLIGAGSVLLRTLKDSESVFGNPAKKINFK